MKYPKLQNVSTVIVFFAVVYQMVNVYWPLGTINQHYSAHIGLMLLIVFFFSLEGIRTTFWRVLLFAAVLATLIGASYIYLLYEELELRSFFNTPTDLIVGVLLMVLLVGAAWKSFGPVIPTVIIILAVYPFLGSKLPEPFHCTAYGLKETISNLSLTFTSGIFSPLTALSASFLFLIITFGTLLHELGATAFFLEVGTLAGSRARSGPGLTAVVSSLLVGSFTGAPAANIAITGSFTIPLMKKTGYKPEQAGAIEATASMGGGIMPPIMATTAFMMAQIADIPYLTITKMAIIPAFLYFMSAGTYVYLRGEQLQLKRMETKLNKRALLISAPLFIVPMIVLLSLLIYGYSLAVVSFWALIATILLPMCRKETRPSFEAFRKALVRAARSGAQICCMTISIGILLASFTMTGLGIKISAGIEQLSHGSLLLALLIVAAISVPLGMAGIIIVSYVIVSIFGVPAIMSMGIPLEQAHFFILMICMFSGLTPPVAMSSLIASKLAGAKYLPTAIESVKVAAGAFIIPFMIVYVPVLVLMPQAPLHAAMAFVACMLVLLSFQIGFVGYLLTNANGFERLGVLLAGILLLIFIFLKDNTIFAIGIVLFALVAFWQYRKFSLEKRLRDNMNSVAGI